MKLCLSADARLMVQQLYRKYLATRHACGKYVDTISAIIANIGNQALINFNKRKTVAIGCSTRLDSYSYYNYECTTRKA